ncbi:carboxymuconolactone decarboxylase family protein [Algoriphagus resistens]|uniref:carboxymuconolactone decarboxylase family protein n=1 Tax=Algoriphagus resistens TaxID=1750590 RepID=UPI000716A7D1|nr:carboxymuconolactone decarboxylase family protein [Algoriphagus resistens]
MQTRILFREISPKFYEGLSTIGDYAKSLLEPKLIELIKYRISQINCCPFCLDMHYKEAAHAGEKELRLHTLPGWRDCPYYTEGERAALAFAEALTEPSKYGLDDKIYDGLAAHFDKEEIMAITAVVVHINSWNRINQVFRPEPGKYKIGQF